MLQKRTVPMTKHFHSFLPRIRPSNPSASLTMRNITSLPSQNASCPSSTRFPEFFFPTLYTLWGCHMTGKSTTMVLKQQLRNDIAHGLNARFYGSALDVDDCQYPDDLNPDTAMVLLKTEAFFDCSSRVRFRIYQLGRVQAPCCNPQRSTDLRMEMSTNQIQSLRASNNDLLHLCPHLGEPAKNVQPFLIWSSIQTGSFQSLCDWSDSEEGHILALIQLQRDALQSQTWSQLVCSFVSMLILLDLRPWSQNDNSLISGSILEIFDNFLRGDSMPNARVVLQRLLHALHQILSARERDSQGENAVVAERLIAVIDRVYLPVHQRPQTDGYLDEYHHHRLGNMSDGPNKGHAEAVQLLCPTFHPFPRLPSEVRRMIWAHTNISKLPIHPPPFPLLSYAIILLH
ncbi:hypothetical protein LY76DRAFT_28957 [Colletotrichum caudatum]|nr:hypothetical protein LY76DRAFT_28957 [Colletotrichum caudatum]